MSRILPGILTATFLITSCIGHTVQHQYKHVAPEGWSRNDTLSFALPPARHEGRYSICTEMRISTTFPYARVCMVRELLLTKPLAVRKDTICISVDAGGVRSEGKGVTLRSFSHTDSTLVLKAGQEGSLRLYHLMSRETLPEIKDVGVKVAKVN